MKTKIPLVLLLLSLFAPAAMAQRSPAAEGLSESLHRVPLSRGGEIGLLISQRSGTSPKIAVLLFAGYPGILNLKEEAGQITYNLGGNFLIRARRFLNTGQTFTVAVDCPTDQLSTCGDSYRSSSQHAADIQEVVTALKTSFGAQQVYVVGTSYGTVSSAFLAAALGPAIDGAIHTSTFTDPRAGRAHVHGAPMASFDWSKAQVPQLFVHHKSDPCDLTRYASVVARKGAIPLITVDGVGNPRGEPCDAFSAHGFVGREKLVMTAIHDWITGRKQPELIGAAE